MQVRIINFSAAILSLQGKLGQTQEGMARKLGCTLGAYSKWVRGENIPSGDWMLRLLALCPDEATRQMFFLEITETAGTIASSHEVELPKEEEEARPGATRPDGRIIIKHSRSVPKRT